MVEVASDSPFSPQARHAHSARSAPVPTRRPRRPTCDRAGPRDLAAGARGKPRPAPRAVRGHLPLPGRRPCRVRGGRDGCRGLLVNSRTMLDGDLFEASSEAACGEHRQRRSRPHRPRRGARARHRGHHTPVLTDAVADLVLALMVMLQARLPEADPGGELGRGGASHALGQTWEERTCCSSASAASARRSPGAAWLQDARQLLDRRDDLTRDRGSRAGARPWEGGFGEPTSFRCTSTSTPAPVT